MNTKFIYGILHPETNQVVYIGQSFYPETRLKQHYTCGTKIGDWLRELKTKPEIVILKETTPSKSFKEEKKFIQQYFNDGVELLNVIGKPKDKQKFCFVRVSKSTAKKLRILKARIYLKTGRVVSYNQIIKEALNN